MNSIEPSYTKSKAAELVALIKAHGIEAWTTEHRGAVRLFALDVLVLGGRKYHTIVPLPTCFIAVRDWLGY